MGPLATGRSRPAALVTGAGTRVGRVIADRLAAEGISLAFHCHTSRAGAQEGAARARDLGVDATVVEADLSDWDAAHELPARAARALGRLDIVVNSAAVFERVAFGEIGPQQLARMLGINFVAPFAVCQGAAEVLARPGGCIVNILDVGARQPWRGYAHYNASKAALAMLTRGLALELAPDIRVNGVAPGAILFPESYDPQQREAEIRRIPLGRAGTPGDVADAVLYLVRSDFVTGEILRVDGGRGI